MEEALLKLLGRKTYVPLNVPELLNALHLEPRQQQALGAVLQGVEKSGKVARIKGNRFVLAGDADLVPGVIRITRQGRGFLQPDDAGQPEIHVAASETSTALDTDHVLVRRDVAVRLAGKPTDEPSTGSVVRILERRRSQIVGTLRQGERFLYVIPDDPRIPHDVYVPPPRDVGRKPVDGDKVVVRLLEWESRHTNPEGEIVEVLGQPDEEGVDMLSVLRQYQLATHFPKELLLAADEVGRRTPEMEIAEGTQKHRVDCRTQDTITIDPDDAKDFDDAICIVPTEDGGWRAWVHIADVSHYVRPGSSLDQEAQKRGNSTYLVDRVIPMLPEALSNELCSLKPDVDRFTKCAELFVAKDGSVQRARFYPAIIRSKRRYTYKSALQALQAPPKDRIDKMLHAANKMTQIVRSRRFKNGSLELDFPESKIRLDDAGKVLRIDRLENDISHQLVEELMLLANEAVATRLLELRRPTLHRVHEPPDERRLQEFRNEVVARGVPCGNLNKRPEVQKLLRRLKDTPIGPALRIGFLKSLMRARYALEPLGHYGLCKEKYSHFTSPIRRYADLVVHRGLFERNAPPPHDLKKVAEHISGTERNSSDAERASRDVKLFAFLKGQLKSGTPQVYDALVFDIRNFGFFIDVQELGMGGLVHLSSLRDDFYIFDEKRGVLVGRRNRRRIQLGDLVKVSVFKVDTFKKQVDFQLVTDGKAAAPKRPQGARRTAGARSTQVGNAPEGGKLPEKAGHPRRAETAGRGSRPRSPLPSKSPADTRKPETAKVPSEPRRNQPRQPARAKQSQVPRPSGLPPKTEVAVDSEAGPKPAAAKRSGASRRRYRGRRTKPSGTPKPAE